MRIRQRIAIWMVAAPLGTPSLYGFDFGPVSMPQDTSRLTTCPTTPQPLVGNLGGKRVTFLRNTDVNFTAPGWEARVREGWQDLSAKLPSDQIYVAAIAIRNLGGGRHGFYYLSNGTWNRAVQPWSSTKWFAAAAAMAKMRQAGIGSAHSAIDGINFAEMVTTAHTGRPGPTTPEKSNYYGTVFLNIAGRDYTNQLVTNWLHRPNESFRGSYSRHGNLPRGLFVDRASGRRARVYAGRTGGGRTRLSPLTMAEVMKRLATHADPTNAARFPNLTSEDVAVLLYGQPGAREPGGMLAGTGKYVRKAVGGKAHLDRMTGGRWRIFTKTGSPHAWSGQAQMLNAWVCLPEHNGGHHFVFSLYAKGHVLKEGKERLMRAVRVIVDHLAPGFLPRHPT